MKTITFKGSGEHTVSISGAPGADADDPQRLRGLWQLKSDDRWVGAWDVVANGEKLRVHAIYDDCWSFAIGLAAPGAELPLWAVNLLPSDSTSVQLELTVPDKAHILPALFD